jgi:hypothetical protein
VLASTGQAAAPFQIATVFMFATSLDALRQSLRIRTLILPDRQGQPSSPLRQLLDWPLKRWLCHRNLLR